MSGAFFTLLLLAADPLLPAEDPAAATAPPAAPTTPQRTAPQPWWWRSSRDLELPGIHLNPPSQPLHQDEGVRADLFVSLWALEAPLLPGRPASVPSMQQALALSSSYLQAESLLVRSVFQASDNALVEVFLGWPVSVIGLLPGMWRDFAVVPGQAWVHEEGHRSVMTQNGVASRNGVYSPPYAAFTFDGAIAVDHVADADLVRFKSTSPADFVRMSSAGMEMEDELALRVEADQFFYAHTGARLGPIWTARAWNTGGLFGAAVSQAGYLATCASPTSDTFTSDMQDTEGADLDVRDFTGLDCNAWAYDLFRPDEPYEARGVHPSGVGIDRYISSRKMTQDERAWLSTQAWLGLLDLADPNLLGINGFVFDGPLQRELKLNARLRYMSTPFGGSVDGIAFLQWRPINALVVVRNGFNGRGWFPGLRGEVQRFPLIVDVGDRGALTFYGSLALEAFLQPKDLLFHSADVMPGGAATLELDMMLWGGLGIAAALDAKSAGFVPGRDSLLATLTGRLGIIAAVDTAHFPW